MIGIKLIIVLLALYLWFNSPVLVEIEEGHSCVVIDITTREYEIVEYPQRVNHSSIKLRGESLVSVITCRGP